jgi:hypothetical protein
VARALVCTRYHRATRDHALASTLHRVRAVQRLGILVGGLLTYLVAVAGCYNPALRDCTVACSTPTDCTGGQVCRGDGFCAMPDAKECSKDESNVTVDAASGDGADAPMQPSLCELGCTKGSCIDGVCVIDCSAPDSCTNDITCPANLPCRVVCGTRACQGKIFCSLATTCQVQCNGDYACKDEIHCNSNRCDVDCIGASSCEKRTRCANACACDVSCIGSNSCREVSECPESACRIGNGCTSLLTGCDSC